MLEEDTVQTDLKSRFGQAWNKFSQLSDYIWSGCETWVNSCLMLGATIIISRNISISEVGGFAIIQLLVVFFQIITSIGITDSIVREKDVDSEYLSTAFWIATAISVLGILFATTCGPHLLRVFGVEKYVYPLYLLSLSLLLNTWSSILMGMLQRSLKFNVIAQVRMFSMFLSTGVGVTLAIRGAGIWSFVALTVCNYFCLTIFFSLYVKWIPTFQFDKRIALASASFNSLVMGANLLSFTSRRGDHLLVGRLIGMDLLGYYSICGRMAFVMLDSLVGVVMRVAYPKVARIINDGDDPSNYWMSLHGLIMLMVAPVFIYLACYSSEILAFCFSGEWANYGYVLSSLSGVSFLGSIRYVNGITCRAYGRPGYMLWLNVLYVLSGMLLLLVFHGFGLRAVCWIWLGLSFLITPITFVFVKKVSGFGFGVSARRVFYSGSLCFICVVLLLFFARVCYVRVGGGDALQCMLVGGFVLGGYYLMTLRSRIFRVMMDLFLMKGVLRLP